MPPGRRAAEVESSIVLVPERILNMMIINLYNLYVGDRAPPEGFARVTVGPFRVELVADYAARVQRMGQHGTKTVSREFHDGERPDDPAIDVTTTTFSDAQLGGWEVTATVSFDEANEIEPSILSREPIPDGGVGDLCELLTFITGRRVTTDSHTQHYDPNKYGPRACIPIETLPTAAVAWQHRQALVAQRLTYALLLHNEALTQNMLQILAGLNNTALNILIDQWGTSSSPLSKAANRELKEKVTAAVDACTQLSPVEKAAFKALLRSKVDGGLGSMTDRTRALLVDLGIVDQETNDDVARRIKLVNNVRNSFTHKGEPPGIKDVKGMTAEQARRYTTAIVTGVVPQIIITALGKSLGFRARSVGSLSQNTRDLQVFFGQGKWRNWPLEELDFEQWFYAELNDLEDALT